MVWVSACFGVAGDRDCELAASPVVAYGFESDQVGDHVPFGVGDVGFACSACVPTLSEEACEAGFGHAADFGGFGVPVRDHGSSLCLACGCVKWNVLKVFPRNARQGQSS